jgi:hypothetical protein
MPSSYFLESAPIYGAYSALIEPTPGAVNIRMTWTEVSEQQSAFESQIRHANYSIPDHLALPGVVLLLILIFHNGRNLVKTWHGFLRNQYQTNQMATRSRRVETLERIFHQDSSRR